jgi:hypothetical protein
VRGRGGDSELRRGLIRQAGRLAGRRFREFHPDQRVRALVLDGLKEPMGRPNWYRVRAYPAVLRATTSTRSAIATGSPFLNHGVPGSWVSGPIVVYLE